MVCNALVAGGRLLGAEQQAMRPGWGKLCESQYVEQIIRAIKYSVAPSWFPSLRLRKAFYNLTYTFSVTSKLSRHNLQIHKNFIPKAAYLWLLYYCYSMALQSL